MDHAIRYDEGDGQSDSIRPPTKQDVADIGSRLVGARLRVRAVPARVLSVAGVVLGRFVPMVKDMSEMVQWFETGRYVADTTRQATAFGPVPTAENAIARYAASLGHTVS